MFHVLTVHLDKQQFSEEPQAVHYVYQVGHLTFWWTADEQLKIRKIVYSYIWYENAHRSFLHPPKNPVADLHSNILDVMPTPTHPYFSRKYVIPHFGISTLSGKSWIHS